MSSIAAVQKAAIFNGGRRERRGFSRVLYEAFPRCLEIATMDQRDQELLEKQLRAINPAPRHDGVTIVTLLVGFLAGITLGGFLVGHTSEPMRVASNDVAPTAYPSIGLAHQLR
jgi:hypothetical protein